MSTLVEHIAERVVERLVENGQMPPSTAEQIAKAKRIEAQIAEGWERMRIRAIRKEEKNKLIAAGVITASMSERQKAKAAVNAARRAAAEAAKGSASDENARSKEGGEGG